MGGPLVFLSERSKPKNLKSANLVLLALSAWWMALALVCACVLAGCSGGGQQSSTQRPAANDTQQRAEEQLEAQVQETIANMTLEQKVAQLFIVRPESLTGVGTAAQAGSATREALGKYPVGGVIYFAENLDTPEQTREMLSNTQTYAQEAGAPPLFLCVDEEGGTVARVASNPAFGVENTGDARNLNTTDAAGSAAQSIAGYLAPLGFNVNFAPVADIANTESTTMARRSFGSSAEEVTPLVKAQVAAYLEGGILPCAKHFPGIGGAKGDSHDGTITATKTLDAMAEEELLPFAGAIEEGVPFIMLGHLSPLPTEGSADTPATLDARYYTYLHETMGFEGIAITDSLEMGALGAYDEDETATQALIAGADMVLMPNNFEAAYENVLQAVRAGKLSEERINDALIRILRVKYQHLA